MKYQFSLAGLAWCVSYILAVLFVVPAHADDGGVLGIFDVGQLIALLATGLGSWIASKFIRTGRDKQRADLLTKIGEDAAALVFLQNPNTTAQNALRLVVEQIRRARVTSNETILERVAASAVKKWVGQ